MSGPARSRRPDSPMDPVRQRLLEVRKGLLRLHKTLIDSERALYEREHGPMTNGEFLQALLNEQFFAWLRPYSGLIVELDEALHGGEAVTEAEARSYVEQVRALVASGDDTADEGRYHEVVRRDTDVLLAHVELNSRIQDATRDD
ncbi:MAG TPA: hypothetical protein VFQ39_19185 [Longimicrobium sp.]|nr:hypothetical protein [Longimicrobium sp.]